jgi:hypothetical protein
MKTILLMVIASVLWVQVPQWSDDWSKCAVDVPDAACHWYVSAPGIKKNTVLQTLNESDQTT